MKTLRLVLGLIALLALAAALNLLVLRQALFLAPVYGALAVAVAAGAAWAVVSVILRGREAGGRDVRRTAGEAAGALIVLGICVIVYAMARDWDELAGAVGVDVPPSYDLTLEGREGLAPITVQVLRSLNQPVEVYGLFLTTGDRRIDISRKKTRRFLKECQDYTDLLEVAFMDPQENAMRLRQMGVQYVAGQGKVVLRSGGRVKEIALSGASPRLNEADFVNALINLVRTAKPKVCYLVGHDEPSLSNQDPRVGASKIRETLEENDLYEVEELVIPITRSEIPADCGILMLNGARGLHARELAAIQEYIGQGGRILYLAPEPVQRSQNLHPWLRQAFGIEVGFDIVITPSREAQDSPFTARLTDLAQEYAEVDDATGAYMGSYNYDHGLTRGFDQQMFLSTVRSVSLAGETKDGLAAAEVLRTAPETYAESNIDLLTSSQPRTTPGPDDLMGPVPVGVAVSAPPADPENEALGARLVVIGDNDFLSNAWMQAPGNPGFLLNCMAWLSEQQELIAARPRAEEDEPIYLREREEQMLAWVAVLGIVQVIAAAGVAVYFVRRRYR